MSEDTSKLLYIFTRRQVKDERDRYLAGEKNVPAVTSEKFAGIITNWLNNRTCHYCSNPWAIMYNEGEGGHAVCGSLKCRTMALLVFADRDLVKWHRSKS
jgi:hypothetical protein